MRPHNQTVMTCPWSATLVNHPGLELIVTTALMRQPEWIRHSCSCGLRDSSAAAHKQPVHQKAAWLCSRS